MKIRFVSKTDERVHGAAYKAGDEVDLPYASAMRWLRRHLAVEVKPEPEPVRLKGRPLMSAEPKAEPVKAAEPKADDKPKRGRPAKAKDA